MALRIRLTRLGDKGNPFYRVVVAESRNQRDGKVNDLLGTYDPRGKDDKTAIKIDKDKTLSWIAKGALPTDTARAVLVKAGVLDNEKPKAKVSKPKPKPAKKPDEAKKAEAKKN